MFTREQNAAISQMTKRTPSIQSKSRTELEEELAWALHEKEILQEQVDLLEDLIKREGYVQSV